MYRFLKRLREFISRLKEKGRTAEQLKAGRKWDSVVEEIRARK